MAYLTKDMPNQTLFNKHLDEVLASMGPSRQSLLSWQGGGSLTIKAFHAFINRGFHPSALLEDYLRTLKAGGLD
ncbi:hypothetical protein CEXT_3581 [Caerostris extrusa]|uniref:Uncharacterized protein n=1 Tax=Caerostris extrusa TaxID=172846 RepID=A0AAV4SLE0_CAEEX|nr:hypothetical protein CEXT_3581 [Caerostris extrusa]